METAGFIFINKPKDITSFICIARIRRVLGDRKLKVGHAGTLDPFATGLLLVAIGREATREISKLMKLDKEYVVTGKLGELTDTLDKTGTMLEEQPVSAVTEASLQQAIDTLGTTYLQTPPIYSALKHEGQPLYKLARQKKLSEADLQSITQKKAREITLHEVELLEVNSPFFTIRAHVSHGTYIRSLVNDIAQQLGTVATTYELERTRIGTISIGDAIDLDALETADDVEKKVIEIAAFQEKYL